MQHSTSNITLKRAVTPSSSSVVISALAELEAEALSVSSTSMASMASLSELEAVTSHARMSPHTSHASTKEGLEDAVGVHIVEASSASAVLEVLAAIIHPPLLLITQDGVSLSDLRE